MKKSKAVLITLIFCLAYSFISWFFFTLPKKTFKSSLESLPQFIDNSLVDRYPDDLLISIKKGQVSLNRPSPFCFILDEKDSVGIIYDANIVSADPASFDADGPYQDLCKPVALVSQGFVMYPDSGSNQIKLYRIPSDINYQIDKGTISSLINKVLPKIIEIANFAYTVIPFVVFISFFVFILLSNIWYAFVSRLVLKLFKVNQARSIIYGTSLIAYNIILFANLVIIDWLINMAFNQNISSISFFMSKSIFISLGCLIYFKYFSPITISKTKPTTPQTEDKSKL